MDRLQAAEWWRFSRYEIRNGAIYPARRCCLQTIRPLGNVRTCAGGGSGLPHGKRMIEPPYQQLVALYRTPQPSDTAATILEWCSRFGLLGILPHRAQSITLPARCTQAENNSAGRFWRKFPRIDCERLVPAVTQHVRTPTGWRSSTCPFPAISDACGRVGELVDKSDLGPGWPAPGMIWTTLNDMNPSIESLEKLALFSNGISRVQHRVPDAVVAGCSGNFIVNRSTGLKMLSPC